MDSRDDSAPDREPATPVKEPGAWIAAGSGVVTVAVVLSLVSVYVYGLSIDPHHVVRGTAVLTSSADEVVALLHDVEARPTWRPQVVRIGRQVDPSDSREVWRELDGSDDRFDFIVVERNVDGIVFQAAAPEQVGYEATWRFSVAPEGSGSRVTLEQEGWTDHPLFRGLFWLRGGPWSSVANEMVWLGEETDGAVPLVKQLPVY